MLILTCGVNGSYVFTPGKVSFVETPKVEVADTVGAGDSFTATFVAALLKGMSITEAHRLAVDVSAFVCTQNGAMPVIEAIPTFLVFRLFCYALYVSGFTIRIYGRSWPYHSELKVIFFIRADIIYRFRRCLYKPRRSLYKCRRSFYKRRRGL